jgi:DHA2 family lincomycin resistance protein-like MFS transporter
VLSIGLALSFTPLFTASLASLQPKFYSYGSAVVGTVQQVAGAAGIALMFGVMAAATAGATSSGADEIAAGAAGTHAAFLTAAFLSLPLLVGAFLIRKPADQPMGAPMGH